MGDTRSQLWKMVMNHNGSESVPSCCCLNGRFLQDKSLKNKYRRWSALFECSMCLGIWTKLNIKGESFLVDAKGVFLSCPAAPPLKFRDVDAERANGLCAPGAGACLTYVTPTNLSTLPQIESTWKIPCIVALTRHSTVSGIFSGLWKAYNSTSIYRSRLPLTISISRHQWLLLHFNIALHRDLYNSRMGDKENTHHLERI